MMKTPPYLRLVVDTVVVSERVVAALPLRKVFSTGHPHGPSDENLPRLANDPQLLDYVRALGFPPDMTNDLVRKAVHSMENSMHGVALRAGY